MRNHLMLATALLLLAACASSPDVRHFDLNASPSSQHELSDGLLILIGPVRWPEYLQRPQMALRQSDNEIEFDEFNRWAEPLSESFMRVLTMNVDQSMRGPVVLQFPVSHIESMDYRVAGRVTRFDVDTEGVANLDMQWGVMLKGSDTLLRAQRISYATQSADPADPASNARALSEAVRLLSDDIVATLRGHIENAADPGAP